MPVAADPVLRGWWARLLDPEEPGSTRRHTLVGVISPAFPPGALVELPGNRRPSEWRVEVRADVDGSRVHRVRVALPTAPLLWYLELAEPDARPGATTLVAFSDDRRPEGTLLGPGEARAQGVRSDQQVAALRWWPGSGLVHQIFVSPQHRRRGVASKLLHAAFGIQYARGLPDLHGDGQRTDLGEEFVQQLPDYVAWRLDSRTHRLAPMDLDA